MSEQSHNIEAGRGVAHDRESKIVHEIFDDFESKSNFVGLFSLLLKIDKRVNPLSYKTNKREKIAQLPATDTS